MDSQFPSSFFFSILFIISMEIRSSWSQDSQFQNCVTETIQCGNIVNIGYPFYGINRPTYCGHPGFELSCNGNTLGITIKSQKHNVLSVNTTAATLTVAIEDYYRFSHCPSSLVNTTIDFSLFSYTNEDENITIYYNCSSSTSSSAGWQSSQFMCPGSTATGYFSTASGSNGNLEAGCSSSVFVPVYKSAVAKMDGQVNQGTLMTILNSGFGLQWLADNNLCDGCQMSGGECGYDWNNDEFQCYCSSDSSRCRQTVTRSKSKKTGVGVGIAIGVVGIIALLGCWSLFILRRRKRLISHANSNDLHSTPSNSNTDSNRDLPSSNGFTTTQTTSGFTTTRTTTGFTTVHTTSYSQNIPSYASSKLEPEKGSTYSGVQVFSYTELEEATNNFDKSRELGHGGFGAVCYGELPNGRAVAVKRLYENNYNLVEPFMNEIEIFARLCHRNLVTLYGCTSKKSQELILVYEYISNGTVADHLHGKRSELQLFTWPIRLNVAVQTADALAYLHASDVIHHDVKTTNILIDGNFQVKVADFGLSRLFPNHATDVSSAPQGTPGYVDPEYFNTNCLTEKSDVYSFGVVLMELISSKEAVDTNRHGRDVSLVWMAVDRIQKNKEFHELVDPRLGFEEDYNVQETIKLVLELAFQCLQQERDLRPSMMEAFLVLKGIQKRFSSQQKQVMVDVKDEDDLALLKNVPPPLSPETRVVISNGRR